MQQKSSFISDYELNRSKKLVDIALNFSPFVFVYGTLKTGFRLNDAFDDERDSFIGEYSTLGNFFVFGGNFPYAVPRDDGLRLKGEVYYVSAKTLWFLDRIEGHPSVYYRSPVLLEGFDVPAWCYQYPEIASNAGDFACPTTIDPVTGEEFYEWN